MGCPGRTLFKRKKFKSLYVRCFCRRAIEIDEEEDDKNVLSIPSQELNAAIRELSTLLENVKTRNDLVSKHGLALQRAIGDIESGGTDDLGIRMKTLVERATLFRISANAMMNVSDDDNEILSIKQTLNKI